MHGAIYTRFRKWELVGVAVGVMSSSEIRNRVRIPSCLPCTIGGDPWKEGSLRVKARREADRTRSSEVVNHRMPS